MARFLEEMSWPEIREAIDSGMNTVLVPCGAVEQHGPHIHLRMDSDHAEGLAQRIAARLGNALVAPSIAVGCSSHHLDFAGTVSLSSDTFTRVCRDYCTSLARHGFRRILFFSGHIGNFPVLAEALPQLREAVPAGCEVEAFTDSAAWLDAWRQAVTEAGGNADLVGGHADIAETSIMLVLRPRAVRLSQIATGRVGLLSQEELKGMWRDGMRSVSANGILGDARGASLQIGERCLEAISELLAEAFLRTGTGEEQ